MKSATRIVIPLLQMVLVVVVYWFAAVHSSDELIHRNYISPAVRLLIKVNFFQIVILYPILVGLNGLNHLLHLSERASTIDGLVATVLGIGFLWYVVVSEIQMRRRKKSLFRFSSRAAEFAKAVLCIVLGLAALVCAFYDTAWLISNSENLVAAILGALILVAWASALIGMGLFDLFAPKAATHFG